MSNSAALSGESSCAPFVAGDIVATLEVTMKARSYISIAVCLGFALAGAPRVLHAGNAPQKGQKFKLGCTLPFDGIKQDRDIDNDCPQGGDAAAGPHQNQNMIKNNFCAEGKTVPILYSTFLKLQKAAEDSEIPFGSSNKLPPDRSALEKLVSTPKGKVGEGTVVSFVAFVIKAKYSNLSKGESNNCKTGGKQFNDIHVELGKTNDDDACKSVTAEISPHFRPETWADFDQYDRTHPVRITGQLFFDGSHAPCRNGKRPNPQRASIWEIHPVYAIEVCKNKSLAGCATTNKSVWIPFDQWATVDDEEESGNR
jgi:hypothetical protein